MENIANAEAPTSTNPLVQAFSIYRDIVFAKRSAPKAAQGASAVQVPFQQNVNAPNQPVNIVQAGPVGQVTSFMQTRNGQLVVMGLGLLGVVLLAKKVLS